VTASMKRAAASIAAVASAEVIGVAAEPTV
jgi:hypothetical protein